MWIAAIRTNCRRMAASRSGSPEGGPIAFHPSPECRSGTADLASNDLAARKQAEEALAAMIVNAADKPAPNSASLSRGLRQIATHSSHPDKAVRQPAVTYFFTARVRPLLSPSNSQRKTRFAASDFRARKSWFRSLRGI
jgi:hypothetical protein